MLNIIFYFKTYNIYFYINYINGIIKYMYLNFIILIYVIKKYLIK